MTDRPETPARPFVVLAARSRSLLALACAPIAIVAWLLLAAPAGGSPAAMLAAATACCALIALVAARPARHASLLLVGAALCAGAAGLVAPDGGEPVGLLLLWTSASAWALLGGRAAAGHTVLAAAVGGAIATGSGTSGDHVLWWAMLASTAVVIGLAMDHLAAAAGAATARANERAAEHGVLARLGRRALTTTSEHALMDDAVTAIVEILGVECCAAFAFDDFGDLRLAAGAGWACDLPSVTASTRPGSEAGFVLAHDGPIVIDDLAAEERFAGAPMLRERGAASGMSVAFRGSSRTYGVLGAHTTTPRRFTEQDTGFLQAVAHILGSAWERLESERATRHAALHDALTGLPNRALLNDRLTQSLARARRSQGKVALLLLDIDNFKLVNDSLGHEAGDALLTSLATRLAAGVRTSDTVARLGGDEFVVLFDGVTDDADVLELTERVTSAWSTPLSTGEGELWVTASVGVTVCDAGRRDAPTMLREGDAAMYRAKALGRGRVAYFDEGMRRDLQRSLDLQSGLRRAFDNGELSMVYQPIVRVPDGSAVGTEALLRWTSERDGPISPAEFVPLAEQTGLIDRLGRFALDQACTQLAAWRARYGPDAAELQMSVNVSAHQLADRTFVDEVASALARHRLPARTLALELTETALLDEGEETRGSIAALHALGVRLVLDDFGTGYSSLSYLTRMPVCELKVDRAFISGPHAGEADAILGAVSSMAASLGLKVVAEGVETQEQLDRVAAHGCELAQGYFFSRPVPAADVPAALGLTRPETAIEA